MLLGCTRRSESDAAGTDLRGAESDTVGGGMEGRKRKKEQKLNWWHI